MANVTDKSGIMKAGQYGQAMVETLIVIFLALLILLGIVQFGLIYSAKSTLNYAAFEAARAGALNYADKGAIEYALARGLAPLYTSIDIADSTIDKVRAVQDARDKVYKEITKGEFACIERINPTTAAINSFAVKDPTGLFPGKKLIPNDHLIYRSRLTKNDVSIQDANLLKLRVTYCYKMIVPIISTAIQRLTGTTADASSDIAVGQSPGNSSYNSVTPAGSFQRNCYAQGRFPIVAQAIIRMQTPVKNDLFPASCD